MDVSEMNQQEYNEIQDCMRFITIATLIVIGLVIFYARLISQL
jgi:hypothetical protein